MADTKIKSKIDLKINIELELSIEEARVLNIITLWGTDAFYKTFSDKLGKTDIEANKKGLYSLFETIKTNLPQRIKEADTIAKKAYLLER